MNKIKACIGLAMVLLLGFTAEASAETVAIRLVRAGNERNIDPELKDVAQLMKASLAFSSFELLDSTSVSLPDPPPVRMGRNYKMSLKGNSGNLSITVSQAGRNLLKTNVALRGSQPLVLGGINTRDGTVLFVLKLRK